jgi:hypothetical protein
MTDFSRPSSASLLDIALGRVPGFRFTTVPGESADINETFQNLSFLGGTQILATGAESWEILSTDANDSIAGTGAQTVEMESLDLDYNPQTLIIDMDGTTPVSIPGSHLRMVRATVLTAGTDPSNTNLGDITIRVSGGGAGRTLIAAGVGTNRDLIFTVPAGQTAFIQNVAVFSEKNRDAILRPRFTPFGGATIETGLIPTYQAGQTAPAPAPLVLEAKSDFVVDCSGSNPNTRVLAFYSFIIADNDKLPA